MKKITKTYSIRLESDFIDEFNNSLDCLPFKHTELIKGYMQSIIDLSKKVQSSNELIEFAYSRNSKGYIVLDPQTKFQKMQMIKSLSFFPAL